MKKFVLFAVTYMKETRLPSFALFAKRPRVSLWSRRERDNGPPSTL